MSEQHILPMSSTGHWRLDLGLRVYGYNGGMDTGPTIARTSSVKTTEPQQELLCSLLARVAAGETAALAALYDATAARVHAVALRITRDAGSAEEVVSDVYLQVWKTAARYDVARGPVIAWLLVICRSRALDHLRRRDDAELHPEPEQLRPDLDRSDSEPFDDFVALERSSRVHAAITLLDDKSKHLLALAFFQGLSHQEIADHTRLPLGSVKTVLRTAMLKLRATLESFDPLEKSS